MSLNYFGKAVIVCGIIAFTGVYTAETFHCWPTQEAQLKQCVGFEVPPHISATASNTAVSYVLLPTGTR
jgi:hypothetical protein